MKKLEQFYTLLLQERTHHQNEILNLTRKAEKNDINSTYPHTNVKNYDLTCMKLQIEKIELGELQKIIDKFKFLYSDEIEVIDGNCREFNISMKEFGVE